MQIITKTCCNLEELCLSDCRSIHEDCLLPLTNTLSNKLTSLNVDNIFLTEECIKQILIDCIYLKFFYTENLIRIIHKLHNSDTLYKYNLETIYCDNTQIYLHDEHFRSLVFSCPKLKNLRINCMGTNEILSSLIEFQQINQLLISNYRVLTYKFDTHLMNYFVLYGNNLKKIHLIHINDVNLRILLQTCTNLNELILEFTHYYSPACLQNSEFELTEVEQKLLPDLRHLQSISLSNSNCSTTKLYLNIDLFKFDLKLLIKKAVNLKYLKFESFNFINDSFFIDLIQNSFQLNAKTIEKIEFIKLNNLNFKPIFKHLLFDNEFNYDENRFKNLKILNLFDCKLVTKANFQNANRILKNFNLNCQIGWS
jgi:hypothetical protein